MADDGESVAKQNRDQSNPSADVAEWLGEIDRAEKDMDSYRKRCDRIKRRYRYESSQQSRRRRFQILWSNIETMKPVAYARRPKPMVENRWKDGEAVARITATLIERTIDFNFEMGDYDRHFRQVRNDYLLYSRGVARFRYEPVWKEDEIDDGQE